ncbi:DNA-binding NarL/FixJ family response regulator [Pseudonocardia cypriaca]|uniref:DNA-binding NarL/FixJ family response regulator n=1 Tax=Pseudonocardia cypriaca TaxID=882449 RepID=A0A543GAJ5_9PSEU|nr:DNA-binding NarL/FixJ family response regulator [Pseudonocardia cypriaca]
MQQVGNGSGNGYPVLVIDDHELFSTSLTMALRNEGFDARTLPVAFVRHFLGHVEGPPGLVVLDLDLGHDAGGRLINGTDLVEGLRSGGWKVLVVSGSIERPAIAAAIVAGAIGSVPKSRSFAELLRNVGAAARGESVMTRDEYEDWVECHRRHVAKEREHARRLTRLSPRELEVLELLAEGKRAASIAQHFVVSMPTVRTHIRSILTKLEVGSQLEAVAMFRHQYDVNGRSA